jgi:hypothetical protein
MSLEIHYKSPNGRYQAKFSGDHKEIFEQQAAFEEIFCNNTSCGKCDSEDTRLNVREVDGNKYYQRVCNKCQYSFSFGQKKKGGALFPKTAMGWTKYTAPKEEDDDSPKPKGVKK